MRLKEFKDQRQLDEVGRLASLFGTTGAAALKQLGNRIIGDPEGQMSVSDKAHKEEFINNFFSAAFKSLQSEIAAGRVDPNLKSTSGPSASPAEPPTAEPAAPTAPAANTTPKVAPGNAKAPGAGQRQTSQNINNYVRGIATSLNAEPDKAKKMALAKELVNFMADRKDYPEWQNAVATAQQIIKKGVPDPNFSNSAINRLKAGQMMEAWQVYWINKLLESIGFTFADLGLTLLKENRKNGSYILAETKFYKLNMIFENIILTEAESVEQWMKRWLPAYLKGVPISDTTTQNLIRATADSYDTKNVKPFKDNLLKLANAIFATAQAPGYGAGDSTEPSGGGTGAGAAPAPAGSTAAAKPEKTGTSTDTIINSLQSLLAKLKGIDPALHAEIIKKIGSGQSLQGLPGGGSKPAAPAAPVSESKRRKK